MESFILTMIMTYSSTMGAGVAIHTQEYSTIEKCNNAKVAFTSSYNGNSSVDLKAYCTKK